MLFEAGETASKQPVPMHSQKQLVSLYIDSSYSKGGQ